MTVYEQFVDQIIIRRDAILSELLGKDGLNFKSQVKNVEELTDLLDRIFYTIDFLQKEGLIKVEEEHNVNDDMFGLPFGADEKKIYSTWYLYDKWKNAAGWKIELRPGLIRFKQQGYKTDSQLKEQKQFWLTIGVALGASATTAILTALLTRPQITSCWRFFR